MAIHELEPAKGILGKVGFKRPGHELTLGAVVILEEGLDESSSDNFECAAVVIGSNRVNIQHILGNQLLSTTSVVGPEINRHYLLKGRVCWFR